jgi:hypothetical protein
MRPGHWLRSTINIHVTATLNRSSDIVAEAFSPTHAPIATIGRAATERAVVFEVIDPAIVRNAQPKRPDTAKNALNVARWTSGGCPSVLMYNTIGGPGKPAASRAAPETRPATPMPYTETCFGIATGCRVVHAASRTMTAIAPCRTSAFATDSKHAPHGSPTAEPAIAMVTTRPSVNETNLDNVTRAAALPTVVDNTTALSTPRTRTTAGIATNPNPKPSPPAQTQRRPRLPSGGKTRGPRSYHIQVRVDSIDEPPSGSVAKSAEPATLAI